MTTSARTTSSDTLDERRAQARLAWAQGRDARVGEHVPVPDSREGRMELERRRDVFARQEQAMTSHEPRADSGSLRVVVARRHEFSARKLAGELVAAGLEVVAVLHDGADTVGVCVAEQPDLLLVDDVLMRMTGAEVLAEVRALCPQTRCVAQVAGPGVRQVFLEAGAHATHLRNAPLADVLAGGVPSPVA